ncbi:hypothetical protein VitviT2T_014864 [Vitis vinifera]|uniref:Uncharacterized protein n=1 Tax=Vitis vinifera TaxID=29760 RepID=A0ABY9CLT9_VITVI|nr:hypothetical protein VitviT2T_014864 [Vitis vinifera]
MATSFERIIASLSSETCFRSSAVLLLPIVLTDTRDTRTTANALLGSGIELAGVIEVVVLPLSLVPV